MSAMTVGGSLLLSYELGVVNNHVWSKSLKRQDAWSLHVSDVLNRRISRSTYSYNCFICRSFTIPNIAQYIPILRSTSLALTRSFNALLGGPLPLRLVPAVGIIVFSLWGLGRVMRYGRSIFHDEANWKKAGRHFGLDSYLQPLIFWAGAILACRTMDSIVLPSEASQAVKQRLLSFVRSSSTVLAFAWGLSCLIQRTQKFFMKKNNSDDARNMGFQLAGRSVYTAVWIAAFSLFMELLGFSTQKWLTAGGLGTVLLTLAGREIFTNFLSSVMIHATRPFIINDWIQTKIGGYEISGTVEHVGWWSPTIIRGDDREAVHIPNHKFTVTVVRNLSQKTHWRIKTHLAISHLDVNKISNIVADMRKTLAKNPQIEQQRLHRRVFLDDINPENQALLILVSCFVKTSRFEEYLCVKEAALQDLLRVISHHQARLATPVRMVQNIYGDAVAGVENIPNAETIFTRTDTANFRFLLTEPRPISKASTKPKASCSIPNEDQITTSSHSKTKSDYHKSVDASESVNEEVDGKPTAPARGSLEENIVLGVALDGSKRPPSTTTTTVKDKNFDKNSEELDKD